MTLPDASAYLRTKVLTASPEELRLLLLDGAIKFLRQGRAGMESKDYEAMFTGITKCRNIVLELINTTKPDPDRELYARVTGLYTFMYTTLVEANMERDMAKCDKVIELLEYERETWTMLMGKLAHEKGIQTAAENKQASTVAVTDPVLMSAAPSGYRPLSMQG
jgi:flagellar secretion chaperone FliS